MIVGIFGDSFADPQKWSLPHGWTSLLSATYNYHVKNFALTSSSLFWSYSKLVKHIDEVDLVIFVATSSDRLYHFDDKLQALSTPWSVDFNLTNNTGKVNISNRPLFKAAKEYFRHLQQPDFNAYVHKQVIKSIYELCDQKNKKLILIPAFKENVPYQTIFSFPLFDITSKELEATFNDTKFRPETPMRVNHMSEENNIRLAKIINDLLQGNLPTVTIDDFEFKKENNPELYWKL